MKKTLKDSSSRHQRINRLKIVLESTAQQLHNTHAGGDFKWCGHKCCHDATKALAGDSRGQVEHQA